MHVATSLSSNYGNQLNTDKEPEAQRWEGLPRATRRMWENQNRALGCKGNRRDRDRTLRVKALCGRLRNRPPPPSTAGVRPAGATLWGNVSLNKARCCPWVLESWDSLREPCALWDICCLLFPLSLSHPHINRGSNQGRWTLG